MNNVSEAEHKNVPVLPEPPTEAQINAARSAVEDTIYDLLIKQPFFAHILMRSSKEYNNRVPTCGVYVTSKVHLVVNPEFFLALDAPMRELILIHECMHVVQNCFSRKKHHGNDSDHRLWNVAADIAINQLIAGMPDSYNFKGAPIYFATIKNADPKGKWNKNETTEYYYEALKQKQGKGKGLPDDVNTLDDHGVQGENSDAAQEVSKKTVKDAYESSVRSNKMGNMPSNVRQMIEQAFKTKLDWKSILRRFVANSSETYKEQRKNKRNRRFGLQVPGEKTECRVVISSVVDTSGSVSEDMLADIHAELHNMVKNEVDVQLIQCDSAVHDVSSYKKGKKIEFVGRGGTDMNPGFKVAKEQRPDAIICFTDGEIPPVTNPGIPTLWVILKNDGFKSTFGQVVHI